MRLKGKKVLGLLLSGSLAFGMVISSNVTGEGITAKAETNISAMQSNHMAAKNVVKSIEYINGKNAFRIKFQNENYFGKITKIERRFSDDKPWVEQKEYKGKFAPYEDNLYSVDKEYSFKLYRYSPYDVGSGVTKTAYYRFTAEGYAEKTVKITYSQDAQNYSNLTATFEENDKLVTHDVEFIADGFNIPSQKVEDGQLAAKPAGYDDLNNKVVWVDISAGADNPVQYDFDKPVSSNLQLQAYVEVTFEKNDVSAQGSDYRKLYKYNSVIEKDALPDEVKAWNVESWENKATQEKFEFGTTKLSDKITLKEVAKVEDNQGGNQGGGNQGGGQSGGNQGENNQGGGNVPGGNNNQNPQIQNNGNSGQENSTESNIIPFIEPIVEPVTDTNSADTGVIEEDNTPLTAPVVKNTEVENEETVLYVDDEDTPLAVSDEEMISDGATPLSNLPKTSDLASVSNIIFVVTAITASGALLAIRFFETKKSNRTN